MLLSPFGRRVHEPWSMAISCRLRQPLRFRRAGTMPPMTVSSFSYRTVTDLFLLKTCSFSTQKTSKQM